MNNNSKFRSIPFLRITFFAGLMLALLIGGVLTGAFFNIRGGAGSAAQSTFHRLLEEYDFKYRQISRDGHLTQSAELERLDNDLDRLEKRADVVESWLSILKRRRQLAALDFRYEQSYRQSSRRAALAFPHSEPIAAVAAAALINNTAITREGEAYLRNILPLLAGSRMAPFRLSLHVLLGDFKNPEQAAANLPRDLAAPKHENILADLTILKILTGDIPSVAVDIQGALAAFPSPRVFRLAAEYYYDFGDLLRAAELFSLLPDEDSLSRQADALWLAGYSGSARTIWEILSAEAGPPLRTKALYNLAMTAQQPEEAAELLERLAGPSVSAGQFSEDSSRMFGLIRFSRLFDASRALAVLAAGRGDGPVDTLIELEILKRRTEIGEVSRIIAESWLLLEQYPRSENLYQWGAWYFDLQRGYAETVRLLKAAERHGFTGPWFSLHQAFRYIREDNLNAADDLLAGVIAANGDWTAAANRGRILEARHDPVRALENYQHALAVVADMDRQTASRIQVRVAHCFKTLGKLNESRRALEYALDLNPDNLTARLELSRLD